MQRIKKLLITVSAALSLAAPVALVPVASAVDINQGVCGGANLTFDNGACDDPGAVTKANNLIATIVNIFSIIVGVVAVIMIIIGGFRYITSGGDSSSVSGAKNTILYAIIGLVIVAVAQIIVKFVLNKATSA